MDTSLEKFRLAKQEEIRLLEEQSLNGNLPQFFRGKRPSFRKVLHQEQDLPAVIAEYKRASPSSGKIDLTLTPEDVASQYAESGASALSVLTEKKFFQGDLSFLARMTQCALPLLRKDFLFHPLQIRQTASTPASALLLIVRLTPNVKILRDLRESAEKFGIDAVVEVFDESDLNRARSSGSTLIQVNARDLDTFAVNRQSCLNLAQKCRFDANGQSEIWIAASGMDCKDHLKMAANAGFDAVLLGTALMRDGHPRQSLKNLLS